MSYVNGHGLKIGADTPFEAFTHKWKPLLPFASMGKHLTQAQIETACTHLLQETRQVRVRDLAAYLRTHHGTAGRTERIASILQCMQAEAAPATPIHESDRLIAQLRQDLAKAEERARDSEEMERHHQHFWAARYAEKLDELEARARALPRTLTPSEQYLRLYQRAAELARRLSQYEEVGPLTGYPASPIPE